MISQPVLQKFRESLRGSSFCPGDRGYEEARAVPNAMIDRRPSIIARCAGAADVIACVRVAREHDILVSVRGGGHSIAGKAVCDGGLMIDMSAMKGIHVDPARRTARAPPTPGATAASTARRSTGHTAPTGGPPGAARHPAAPAAGYRSNRHSWLK